MKKEVTENGREKKEGAEAKQTRFSVGLKGEDEMVGRNPGKGRGTMIRQPNTFFLQHLISLEVYAAFYDSDR